MADFEPEVTFVPLPEAPGGESGPGNGRIVEVVGPGGQVVRLPGSRPRVVDLTSDRPGVEWDDDPPVQPSGSPARDTEGLEPDASSASPPPPAGGRHRPDDRDQGADTGKPAGATSTPDTDAAEADDTGGTVAPAFPAASGGTADGSPADQWPLEANDPPPTGGVSRMPLWMRIGLPVLVVTILALLLGLMARRESDDTQELAADYSTQTSQYQVSADASGAVVRTRLAALEGIGANTDESLTVALQRIKDQQAVLREAKASEELLNSDNRFTVPVAELLDSDASYLEVTEQMVQRAETDREGATSALESNREFFDGRVADHTAVKERFEQDFFELTRSLQQQQDKSNLVFPFFPLLLALLGVIGVWWAYRSIMSPLRHITQTLDWISQGQFRVRSGISGTDELGKIGAATDQLAERLGDRFSTLAEDARRGTQNRVIYEALEIADSEPATFAVVEQALGLFAPELPGELLLVDQMDDALHEVAVSPTARSPHCPVEDPSACFALRRGQTVVFDSSESINSCPMLRGRPGGPVSAVCVPMTFNSQALGVLHITGPNHLPPDTRTRDQFIDLGAQTATHIGTLRTLEVTRQQASTDGLTGLANRRVIEARVGQLLAQVVPFVLVLADLDRFKSINDRFGHEVGDRALQAFAAMLVDNVRGADVVGRLGGEEFIIIYPELSVAAAMEAIERLRVALSDTTRIDDIPTFTASFGVTHSSVGSDFDAVVRVADAGLLMAKDQGRDRAIYATPDLAEQVFGDGRPSSQR